MPLFASDAPNERLAAGSMVLMSIISIPARPVSRSPPGPLTTPATSGVFGSMVMITSAVETREVRSPARAAPLSTSVAMWAATVSKAETGNPLADERRRHRPAHAAESDEANSFALRGHECSLNSGRFRTSAARVYRNAGVM